MGKHAAPEGASANPIVAEALAHRSGEAVHHAAVEGPVGWPGEPPSDSPVGWPGDLDQDGPEPAAEPARADAAAVAPTPARGWRRLLGPSRVA